MAQPSSRIAQRPVGRRGDQNRFLPAGLAAFLTERVRDLSGLLLMAGGGAVLVMLLTYDPADPSWNTATTEVAVHNALGRAGAYPADLLIQTLGVAAFLPGAVLLFWGWRLLRRRWIGPAWLRVCALLSGLLLAAVALAPLPSVPSWPGQPGLSGAVGALLIGRIGDAVAAMAAPINHGWIALVALLLSVPAWMAALGLSSDEWRAVALGAGHGAHRTGHGVLRLARAGRRAVAAVARRSGKGRRRGLHREPHLGRAAAADAPAPGPASSDAAAARGKAVVAPKAAPLPSGKRAEAERQPSLQLEPGAAYELPPLDLLSLPDPAKRSERLDDEALRRNAEILEGVLADYGVRGEIVRVNPGPVVTLYELEPAPGIKSSRVIGLADDIARSMSAVSVRVAVVPGRNVIGIELPNARRETVYLREILASETYERAGGKLPLALGKDIGGAPKIVDLARMPHLLVAGTTGSGKSVAINTMILSLLYRLSPEHVRFILVDPKMLELSVYEGIPHLLAPVVTEPKQAVVALKWAVREMESRYRAMSRLGVRNIEGYNQRLREAKRSGETLLRRVQTGFDPDTGKPLFEEQPLDLTELPYIVVVVDEMADLMLVAGKDIEAAIQRLAQMARAAGLHLIMATQRPSVDVITGTIKANFPTRISFQVTSKIDSRTILGEQGGEQLLGLGDMLFMAGGGRITRVHGPFVSDHEVEAIVAFLKAQGEPDYNDSVLEDEDEAAAVDALLGGGNGDSGDELYDRAVALVARERKASTSFIQRHLQIGYNRAARIIERMEAEGVVSQANHVGRREVLTRREDEI